MLFDEDLKAMVAVDRVVYVVIFHRSSAWADIQMRRNGGLTDQNSGLEASAPTLNPVFWVH